MAGTEKPFYSQIRHLGLVTTIPVILLAGPAVGYCLGVWLDRKAHSGLWLTAVFVFLGFAASAKEMFRILKQVSEDDKTGTGGKKHDRV